MENNLENNHAESMDKRRKIIETVFSKQIPTVEELEKKYPPRELQEGAMVTRIAPSPTGFMHIGGLYTALISEHFAHQTNGIFYLRIEDTDRKREVDGASELISKSLCRYNIKIDEGKKTTGDEIGLYGPYKQSNRAEIYTVVTKHLFEKGLAYFCFCTPEELEEMHNEQKIKGARSGYYGSWAKWRNKSDQEVLKAIQDGKPYVIRFKSNGDFNNRIGIKDELLGNREFPENDQDIIIMKSDGLPTYHMAHVIDDHFMRTTHVIRGDEWLPSLPLHLQLFRAMDWQPPHYGHISPIQKIDGISKRKLSKRKDPEANVEYYNKQGYPEEAILEYLLNLANSNFEDWKKVNPSENINKFVLTFNRLKNSNGALFDFNKLNDISKNVVSHYSAKEVYDNSLKWAKENDIEFNRLLEKYKDYSIKIFGIERDNGGKSRKDIAKWSDIKQEIEYFFDELFFSERKKAIESLQDISKDDIDKIIKSFVPEYNEKDCQQEWFDKLKVIAKNNGYAESVKEFKKNPDAYKGNIVDVTKIFRIFLTGRSQTPDLYSIMQVMGKERVIRRLGVN